MIKKVFLSFVLLLVLVQQSFAANGQVVISADDTTVISASAGRFIIVQAIAVIATSTTAVQCSFYHDKATSGEEDMLGSEAAPITVDLDGIDGPNGFVLPFNQQGWFQTKASNKALKIRVNSTTPVIVVLTYKYENFYE